MNRNKYSRLIIDEKEKIKELTLGGKSLRQISRIMNLGITTIYYHVRKLKGKQRKNFKCELSDFEIGELVGAFAGDGSFYHDTYGRSSHYSVSYYLSYKDDQDYAKYLTVLLKKMSLNPMIFFSKHKGELSKITLRVSSKDFYNLIKNYLVWEGKKTYSVRLKEDVSNYNDEFLKGFIRGLMDTDGFVEPYNPAFGVVSKKLSLDFRNILDIFKVKYSFRVKRDKRNNRKDLYFCRICGESRKRYYELFSFSNLRKQNALLKILNGATRI